MTTPISNALVTAIPSVSGYPTLSGYTNDQGQVILPMIPGITYTIQISGPAIGKIQNFVPQTTTIYFNAIKNVGPNKVKISNVSLSTNKSILIYNGNSKLPIKATVKKGYKFGRWKNSPINTVQSSTKSSTILFNIASNISVNFSSVVLALSKLYVVDGWNQGSIKINDAYNPATNTWSNKASDLNSRYALAAGVIGSKLYAVDGYPFNLAVNNAYNPSTNTWSKKASDLNARDALAAGVIGSKLYAVDGDHSTVIKTNNAYSPVTNTWSKKASDLNSRYNLAAGVIA